MTTLVVGVFLASLLGSLHCAGMCGAFLAIAVTGVGDGTGRPRQFPLQAAYHLGRLATYTLLGLAAGAAGQLIDLTTALAGARPIAASLAGATLLTFGLFSLLRIYGIVPARLPAPAFMQRLLRAGHRRAFDRPPVVRAAMIGLLTTLLPCGWLYAFVLTAAGTASPWRGGTAMAVFWLGTLPMMVALGATIRGVTGVLGRRLPVATCLALIGMGLFTLVNRARLDPAALAARVSVAAANGQQATAPDKAPCCEIDTHDR
jgi:sulfite exporter TauE/SafE